MKIAIVTGGSSGLGEEFVRLLSEKGAEEIWVAARSGKKLAALQERFPRVRAFSVDLAEFFRAPEGDCALVKALREQKPEVLWLVNSAGYGKFGGYDELSDADELDMIALNAGALVAVTRAVLPFMPRGGRVINVASCASFQPLPYFNVYAATKAFVQFYSRGLAREVEEKGISVTAVCPPWMRTPFFDVAQSGAGSGRVKNFTGAEDVGRVAKKAVRDAEKNKRMSVCGWFAKTMHVASKLLPRRAVEKIWLAMQK